MIKFKNPSGSAAKTFKLVGLSLVCIAILTSSNSMQVSAQDELTSTPTSFSSTTTSSSKLNLARQNDALDLIRDWSSRFGRDIHFGTQEATCFRTIRDQYDPAKSDPSRRGNNKASIVSIVWTQLHGDIVNTISTSMSWHKTAVEAIAQASEELAGNYTFVKNSSFLEYSYTDVHRLQNADDEEATYSNEQELGSANSNASSATLPISDESSGSQEVASFDGNGHLIEENNPDKQDQQSEILPKPSSLIQGSQPSSDNSNELQTPIKYLKLSKHKNFGDILINTEESAVHIPVHIYPHDEQVMSGIIWSEDLTKVFKNNFVRNPKLTNQYFASTDAFLRLYPAQKWQIARTDPDLYDARMRPWYVAAASSRKDVIILLDSSGSMTGSRRDIAKGVVFEILDTLTDNDRFLILRFSDSIQQVGVPPCAGMRVERHDSISPKHTMFHQTRNENETDVDAFFLLPASGRNVRQLKTNFTIPTSGIANFSKALITAFEVLHNYRNSKTLNSDCNQAIMLITDGSPSDFEPIFNSYNYPNAPVRVFTYLIGREAGDVTHTKMMACRNRGYYTHVINLAEVRETVQQYIPVMARPLVLHGIHPITWTPAYGELTYQVLTDWIWESKRREKARAILGAKPNLQQSVPDIKVTNEDSSSYYSTEDENYEIATEKELDLIDLFGYNSDPDCFWQTTRNDLLTTVVQPVYDRKNESVITEKFLQKNVWTVKETKMKTAKILGVAAADMKINDIIALAPSHKLGPNGYAIMLTNNGFVMHHPDLKSILEPLTTDPSERNLRILKPYFSSMDFTQVEHILNQTSDNEFITLREEAVSGLTGWRELLTKRTLDCQKRVQSRKQSFYYRRLQQFPFSFMIAIPQPYGSHRIEAQIEIKSANLPEKLTTYFTASDYDIWTVHPDYQYCEGPSNNTVTTLLDMFQRIEARKLDEIQWKPTESKSPPVFLPEKIVCDKDLVQSLVYDAVATFFFSDNCGPPSPSAESSLLGMFGVRFSFIATRSGLTRVRFDTTDERIKKEALAFAKKHARAIDETYYSRTVDYNMLVNENATLVQVPFNSFEKIADKLRQIDEKQKSDENPLYESALFTRVSDMTLLEKLNALNGTSLHVIATQSIVVNEGNQSAVAAVSGIFYDYASFVLRFFNSTNSRYNEPRPKQASCFTGTSESDLCDDSKTTVKCGLSNDTIDCLLIDNNGYIVVSENLNFIGRHLKTYDSKILQNLVNNGVFHEINITDYQSICVRQEEKQQTSSAFSLFKFSSNQLIPNALFLVNNLMISLAYTWTTVLALTNNLLVGSSSARSSKVSRRSPQSQVINSIHPLLPNKTYLRPCEKVRTLYEARAGKFKSGIEHYKTSCNCEGWFVYEQVPNTNLFMLIVDYSECKQNCDVPLSPIDPTDPIDARLWSNLTNEELVCSFLERESRLYRKKLDSCFFHHRDEESIKLCGAATKSTSPNIITLISIVFISTIVLYFVG